MDFKFKIESFSDDIYQMVDYEPHIKQQEFHTNLGINPYTILRKSRGMGGTTTLLIESLIRLGLRENYTIGYVPPNYTAGGLFMRKLHDIYISQEELPAGLIDYTRGELTFDNDSRVLLINNPDKICGKRPDWFIFDDCFVNVSIKHILDIAMSMDSDISLVATPPNGENVFKRFYYGSMTKTNSFKSTDYMWYDHPNFSHDIEWVRGNVRIPNNNCDITKLRLLEFGFHRESPTYNRYLKMFGHNPDGDINNIESYAKSTY